jgi:RecA-family ATPase
MDGLVNAGDLKAERIEWLWKNFLPFDTLTIVDGDSTVGKSLTMVDLIARMSRDDVMPDGAQPEPCAIVVLNKEDHWNRVTVPRLDAARANRTGNRIWFLQGKRKGSAQWQSVVLPADINWLAEKIEAVKKASGLKRVLFYADPLMAVVEDRVNSHNYHEMIRALEPIHRLCGDTGCAFVGIRHLTKSNPSGKAIHAGQGSTAIFSTSRMGLMVAYDPDDQSEEEDRARLLLVNGTNLGPKKKSLRWRVEVVSVETQQGVDEVPRIRWDGESGVTADEIAMLNSGDRGPGALVKANLRPSCAKAL